ncbi:MAG: HAMP domain-containing protein [Gemmatimonadetes bacterium]|nr:HAMP domain-containing protein [Gemmatimonadota bacterium]
MVPPPTSGTAADRWPLAWLVCVAAAGAAFAVWQHGPSWKRLAVAAAPAVLSAVLLPTVRRPRWAAFATSAALVLATAIAVVETATLTSVWHDWSGWSAQEREARAGRVAARVTEVADVLRRSAGAYAGDPAFVQQVEAGQAPAVTPPLAPDVESAVLVYHRGRLVAQAGQTHTPVPAGGASGGAIGVRLIESPFHISLAARAQSPQASVEVVAIALLSSAPPADRFARPLLATVPGVDAAHTIIESPDSASVSPGTTVVVVPDGSRRLARVRAATYSAGETELDVTQRLRTRNSIALAVACAGMLAVAWRRPANTRRRLLAALLVLGVVGLTPLSGLSNVSAVFDPSTYFAPMGGPLTSTAAALLITAALALAVLLFALRSSRRRRGHVLAVGALLVIAVAGPFLLRDLARGIALPVSGAGVWLWVAWQLALTLVGATMLLAGAAAGQAAFGARRAMPAVVAPLLASATALAAPVLWSAPGAWPGWYPIPWILAMLALALTRRGLAQVLAAAVVAGCGAVTLTWGATMRARVALAEHDLARLSTLDENALRLLERFAQTVREVHRPEQGTTTLLRRYGESELARAGYPARLAVWSPDQLDSARAVLALAPVTDTAGGQSTLALLARSSGTLELRTVTDGPITLLLAAVPDTSGTVITIAVPPRTRLLPVDPFATFTGVTGTPARAAPYRMELRAPQPGDTVPKPLTWRRRADALHADGVVGAADVPGSVDLRRVHAEVELRGLDALAPRGALLVLLDAFVVLGLWAATALADGAFGRLVRVRRARWSRSYRARLSAALLAFFIAPAATFALWAWYRLQDDDRASRELLIRETLRVAAAEQGTRAIGRAASSTGAPLFLYRDGVLETASDSVLDALAPLGRLLPAAFADDELEPDEQFVSRRITTGRLRPLVGFRRLGRGPEGDAVLATPARGDEFALDGRREDLGVLVLVATMLGALAAVWLSGVAARSLARPVGELREAALTLAAGSESRLPGAAPATEFGPVYRAFGRMAQDLATSRAALEAAQRRTAAVLQHVASGVLGILPTGEVSLANPQALTLLDLALPTPPLAQWPPRLRALGERTQGFLARANADPADEESFALRLGARELRGRLTRLPAGAVLTLDDVTDLASAQRVLAWGEMARQVAHEIKNPLTPIRLGVQHLRRAWRDGRSDFGTILDTNVGRVLEEIDHLDEIARAFSRYGTAPSERAPAVPVDVGQAVQDVVQLEQLGGDHHHDDDRSQAAVAPGESGGAIQWRTVLPEAPTTVDAFAQRDELKEVLLNLLENARLAGARTVRVEVTAARDDGMVHIDVQDDGGGIAPEVLPRIFEPHFSTRTSGSGLGLAISRRLVEGWGGTLEVVASDPQGTRVRLRLRSAPSASPGR